MDLINQSMGKIARNIPGATAVFYNQDLDFCCGGAKTLAVALDEKGLDPAPVIAQLTALLERTSEAEDFSSLPDNQLIEHILTRYHDVHREQLPELIRLAQRVERVHGNKPECPVGLWRELEKLLIALEEHMEKEEGILFPMILRGMGGMAKSPVAVMRQEHEMHAEGLAAINKLTHNINLPQGACNTWRALYTGLESFKSDFMNHIHLENNILFDRIDRIS
jgi:regulator of cell morphogenesis and NO signaling